MANRRETVEERLNRMKHLARINEANYSLVSEIEEDDDMPDLTEPEQPALEGGEAPAPETGGMTGGELPDETMNDGGDDGQIGVDLPNDPNVEAEEGGMEDVMAEPPAPEMEAPAPEEPSVEEKQNDIIRLNISAMQKMQKVIDDLDHTVDSLNSKINNLSADVEEVREPTNVEKLMDRKEDSHPFYYNLNDMWEGNSFQARRQEDGIRGINKMEDGTYIADFDDLPKHNDREIDQSFTMNIRENKSK